MGAIVAYYRVSTQKQGLSGLGLEAQEACVGDFARLGLHTLIASYREVETGKRTDRTELAKALSHARRAKATLCIAKLDRLARNMAFTANLMESGVEFVACDNPHASRLTIHILAAVAEDEGETNQRENQGGTGCVPGKGRHAGEAREPHSGSRTEGQSRPRVPKARTAYAAVLPGAATVARVSGVSLRGESQRSSTAEAARHGTGVPWNHNQVRQSARPGRRLSAAWSPIQFTPNHEASPMVQRASLLPLSHPSGERQYHQHEPMGT